jgi:hypothetical protein
MKNVAQEPMRNLLMAILMEGLESKSQRKLVSRLIKELEEVREILPKKRLDMFAFADACLAPLKEREDEIRDKIKYKGGFNFTTETPALKHDITSLIANIRQFVASKGDKIEEDGKKGRRLRNLDSAATFFDKAAKQLEITGHKGLSKRGRALD